MGIVEYPRIVMSRAEFRAWAEHQPRRHELHDGEVVEMNAERLGHALVKARIWSVLDRAIRAGRLPCMAFPDGATVEVGDRTDFIPDVAVHAGAMPDLDGVTLPAPVIVVEVLSPATERRDLGRKMRGYFQVPSIVHYLLVDWQERTVIHHRRNGEEIATRILSSGGALSLDPPGISVEIAEFFSDLDDTPAA
ncbi:MAG: Uma2 family endonuclease [Acetobacteraceae bacterium]|nr:Uma2 family endonuclease [Acetobacteraceae bacterium]